MAAAAGAVNAEHGTGCASRIWTWPVPSFPSSAWERTSAKLCFASGRGSDAKRSFADRRSQAELGNEGTEAELGNEGTDQLARSRRGPPQDRLTPPGVGV